jgi:hypothetical protein
LDHVVVGRGGHTTSGRHIACSLKW